MVIASIFPAQGGRAAAQGRFPAHGAARIAARTLSQSHSLMSMSSEQVRMSGSVGCTAMLLRAQHSAACRAHAVGAAASGAQAAGGSARLDLPPSEARSLLGQPRCLGLTAGSVPPAGAGSMLSCRSCCRPCCRSSCGYLCRCSAGRGRPKAAASPRVPPAPNRGRPPAKAQRQPPPLLSRGLHTSLLRRQLLAPRLAPRGMRSRRPPPHTRSKLLPT